jgi:pSer/pThr/pTyr-binding forkhead associated (FHA) protein
MPRLIVKQKAEVVDEFILKGSQVSFKIGSEPDNDLVIDDKRISMRHAKIERHANTYYLEDLKSAFGTFHNDKKVDGKIELKNGDEIKLGEHVIVFDNPLEYLDMPLGGGQTEDYASVSESSARENTSESATHSFMEGDEEVYVEVLEQGGPENIVQTKEAPAPVNNGEMAPYYLLAIYGPYTGKRYQLRYGETKIGRDVKLNDIVIRQNKKGEVDPSISRRHATVSYQSSTFYIGDKRSKTRTYVNQNMVPENTETELHPNDEIEIVSDQHSTILRFVAEGNWDFSPPKKAGVWSVRHRGKFMATLMFASVVLGLWLLGKGWFNYSLLTQSPDTFALELAKWRPYSNQTVRSSSFNGETSGSSQAAIADFNNDGFLDFVSIDHNKHLTLVNGASQKPEWTITAFTVDPSIEPVAADLNKNGLKDIVAVTENGRLVGIDGKLGAEIWESPYFQIPLLGPPIVADFDGDGNVDVAIAEQSGKVQIGFGQIVNLEWVAAELGVEMLAPLSAAYLNQDGRNEILCGTERGLVLIIDGVSRKLAGTVDINNELIKARGSGYEDNRIRFPVGVADLNGDARPDLVMTSVQGNLIVVDGATKNRLWDDRLVEGLTLNTDFPYPFAIADVTGDKIHDVVITTEAGHVIAYEGAGDGHGNKKELWRYTPADIGSKINNLVLSDVNKDKITDVLFIDQSSVLKILNGTDGSIFWTTNQPISERTSMPLVADFDNDELLDIILASESGSIYQYKSNSRVPRSAVLWGQRLGQSSNNMHSGFILPGTTGPVFSMAIGSLMFFGAGIAVLIVKIRRKRIA